MDRAQSQNKLGVMPVGKLLAVMSLPMMLSMLVQALYNAVDAMFVARLSEEALTAVSLAFPFQNTMIAVGVGSGIPALRICALSLVFGGFSVLCSSSFQSLGYSGLTLLVSICRQVVFSLPLAWLLSRTASWSGSGWPSPSARLPPPF